MTEQPGLEQLPLKLEPDLRLLLRPAAGTVGVSGERADALPFLQCALSSPATTPIALRARVHSKAGIPLASAVADIKAGESVIQTPPLELLAMEGYSHLKPADRAAVQRRVWSRRAYVTITLA